MSDALVLPIDDDAADRATAGGKGASLARLCGAGLPVPPGFHVTTRAYREFVSADGLDEEIRTALREADPDDPVGPEHASRVIAAAFDRRELPPPTATAIRRAYAGMPDVDATVAVRSSAIAEDLPGMSFAGQQDTFLNVTGADAVLAAIKRCWASLWSARTIGYRARHDLAPDELAMAVVVQRLVPAEAAGVLFTANPLTGARDELVINAAWGLGEAVVGGQVSPDSYVLAPGTHRVISQDVNDKAVMTVRVPDGTREQPVPEHLRQARVLDDARLVELAEFGERIQRLYGTPMDIEWAIHNGQCYIVQARPITGPPDAEVWNDSLRGDYLWTRTNLGEAVPSVMTPVTWSVTRVVAMPDIGGHPMSGNIGGRFYLNLSVSFALAGALGLDRMMRRGTERVLGRIPDDVEVPPLPMSRFALLRAAFASAWPVVRHTLAYRRRLPRLLAETPALCESLHERIRACHGPGELRELWRSTMDSLLRDTCRALEAGARQSGADRIGPALRALVGEADAATLMTGLHGASGDELVSLGPLLGLARLRRGEIDRDAYVRAWGHRCPDEFELSAPRPAEDPEWIDRQLAGLGDAAEDPEELLRRQAAARDEAWQRFRRRHPRRAAWLRRRLDRAAVAARQRERGRSEFVRTFWVFRAFVLRAGELTWHGEELFFLSVQELLTVLDGDEAPLAAVPARRAAYERYRALPPYPTFIRGHFDPVAWAADPARRADIYDATAEHGQRPMGQEISGVPGAAGVVEGAVRVVATVRDGEALRAGEILVTSVTNVGWTPLFPRAAAVITDIGAPLSHAAIVARELGIPAVVGCGNATARLSTGDRVRVDGTRGTVSVLSRAGD